ncbi:MAG TPA: hypothetical protein DCE41_17115 [Cytophagales bacterium]|nr:hypothetical protein [Cytophagales bacterium]HAA18199.1 hypothetical protein [Cytophagales bacterium]HAP59212.1 hypothetical protein [Cytophagales bacterium]
MPEITVQITVRASLDRVWKAWTEPKHITQWNFASPDWHCPSANNDLTVGGTFSWRMEAKDGSMGFDYEGTYKEVSPKSKILATLGDGRKVEIRFAEKDGAVEVTETFEADENNVEMQRQGWQAILENFKSHAEATA